MNACWEEGARPAEQALDVAIFRLRKKLKTFLAHTGLIKTVRGSGYMFDTSSIEVDSAAAGLVSGNLKDSDPVLVKLRVNAAPRRLVRR